MVPPRSCPLIAIIPPPSHTMINTISKSKVLSSAAVPELNTLYHVYQYHKKAYLHTQYQTKNERSPKIPVSYFFSFFFDVVGCAFDPKLQWINHDFEFIVNSHQISFYGVADGFVKGAERIFKF